MGMLLTINFCLTTFSVFSFRLLVKQEVSHDDCKSGMMAMSMPPLPPPLAGGVQQQVNDLDKKLMPPPPPPPTGQDRGQPDRKKIKGNTTGSFSYKCMLLNNILKYAAK